MAKQTWTGFVGPNANECEEIDVEASSKAEAIRLVKEQVAELYPIDFKVFQVVPLEDTGNLIVWR
jgi:hypothetical protein